MVNDNVPERGMLAAAVEMEVFEKLKKKPS
jgi:hypothetical protein